MIKHYAETLKHKFFVALYLVRFMVELARRAAVHDNSKLRRPEAPEFARLLPRLQATTYGSPEYEALLEELDEALRHHYAANSHHPEHYEEGFEGMDLYDLVEMWCDWKAAVRRHDDGDLARSIRTNRDRFMMAPQVALILYNQERRHHV